MIPLEEVLKRAQSLGFTITRRTFWRYWKQGLLHQGEKIPGRGNVLYFPEDVVEELSIIHWWKLTGFSFQSLDYRLISGLKGVLKSYGAQLPPVHSIGARPLLQTISATVSVLSGLQRETISAYRNGSIDGHEAKNIVKNTLEALERAMKVTKILESAQGSRPKEEQGRRLTFALIREVLRLMMTTDSDSLEQVHGTEPRRGSRKRWKRREKTRKAQHD